MAEDNSYDSKETEFSKARITHEAIKKCLSLRSEEMRSGYYNYVISNNSTNKVWVPDTRDKYISSVIALKHLLNAEIKRDKEIIKFIEKNNEEVKNLFNIYSYSPYKLIIKGNTKTYEIDKKIKYIPAIDGIVQICIFDNAQQRKVLREVPKGWNSKTNAYKDLLVDVYDKLFAEINSVVDRIKYFKEIKN